MAKIILKELNLDVHLKDKTLEEQVNDDLSYVIGDPATEVLRDKINYLREEFLNNIKLKVGENLYEMLLNDVSSQSPYIWAIRLKLFEILRQFDNINYQIQQYDTTAKQCMEQLEDKIYKITKDILKDFWTPDEFYDRIVDKIQ